MTDEKLKPCPFCNDKANLMAKIKKDTGFTIWAECTRCGASIPGYCPNIEKADLSIQNIENAKRIVIELWNRREKDETN